MLNMNRTCRLADFEDEDLQHEVRALAPERPDLLTTGIHRKTWELAMVMHALRSQGLLDRDEARFLLVGAGTDACIFALTGYGEVHAVDLYGESKTWSDTAPANMLLTPEHYAPQGIDWYPDRLHVQRMNARALTFANEAFDAVIAVSAVEHFGDEAETAAALRQMARVLKPDGLMVIATEWVLEGDAEKASFKGLMLFNQARLERLILEATGLHMTDTLDVSTDAETLATAITVSEMERRPRFPHIVLQTEKRQVHALFTSVVLTLAAETVVKQPEVYVSSREEELTIYGVDQGIADGDHTVWAKQSVPDDTFEIVEEAPKAKPKAAPHKRGRAPTKRK